MTLRVVFLHGWGFDAGMWDAVRARLPPGLAHAAADRGYFGPPLPVGDAAFVAVGHSLGVLHALAHRPAGLLSINGFARLVRHADWPHGVPPRVLDRMAARLAVDPGEVVRTFRRQHGDATALPGPAGLAPLAADLDLLRQADARQALASYAGPLRVLAGEADALADPALTAASFPGCRIETLPGGHLLPLTHPQECAHAVLALVDRLRV